MFAVAWAGVRVAGLRHGHLRPGLAVTTVAWDGQSIAADRLCGGHYEVGKLFRLTDGAVLGGAGTYDQIVEIVAWVNEGCKNDAKPKLPEDDGSDLLLVTPEGVAYWLTWPYLRRVQINEPFAAVGSGAEFALGAMAMGASARRAVQVAMRFDPYTGKGINAIRVKRP